MFSSDVEEPRRAAVDRIVCCCCLVGGEEQPQHCRLMMTLCLEHSMQIHSSRPFAAVGASRTANDGSWCCSWAPEDAAQKVLRLALAPAP